MTDNRLFFDSNIWLDYFLEHEGKIGQLVESPEGKVFTSILSFHEVSKVLIRNNRNMAYVKEALRFMRENSTVVDVNEDITLASVKWCLGFNKLAAIDSMIYQSALNSNALLITADNDFQGLACVQVVKV